MSKPVLVKRTTWVRHEEVYVISIDDGDDPFELLDDWGDLEALINEIGDKPISTAQTLDDREFELVHE